MRVCDESHCPQTTYNGASLCFYHANFDRFRPSSLPRVRAQSVRRTKKKAA